MLCCSCKFVCRQSHVQIYESPFAEVDVVALIQCTSPFLKAAFLAEAYSKMQDEKYDSVFSVTREYKLRWKELPGMISDTLFYFFSPR
jgi:CMP-N-acetylneuraminic acid synthetase